MLVTVAGMIVANVTPVRSGERLLLTAPGAAGRSGHYARPGDLAVDRRASYAKNYRLNRGNGYGHPSRILGAPLDLRATPFERLGRNAEQNEVDIRSRAAEPDALARPRRPYDPMQPPSAQGSPLGVAR